MAKNNRQGKAKIWSDRDIKIMRSHLPRGWQRLFFELHLYTGERVNAILQLKVSDLYDSAGNVLDTITFGGSTRKASKHGRAKTRQIFVNDELRVFLENYNQPESGYLFPSSHSKTGYLTRKAVDKRWRSIFDVTGLSGYSTHSGRHWLINKLDDMGAGISTIADAMCIDPATVRSYLRYKGDRANKAIASVRVAV